MPFDAPYQTPFGDIELLTDARSRIANRNLWVRHRFEDVDRHCLVAALSLACGSRSFQLPNQTEKQACSADRQADTARCAIHDKVQAHTCQTAPYVTE